MMGTAPRDIGRILDDTLVLYRENFRSIFLAALALLFPVALLGSISGGATYALGLGQLFSSLSAGTVPQSVTGAAPAAAVAVLQAVYYAMVPARFAVTVWLTASIHASTPSWMAGRKQTPRDFLRAAKERGLHLAVVRFLLGIFQTVILYVFAFGAILVAVPIVTLMSVVGPTGAIIGLALGIVVALAAFVGYAAIIGRFLLWEPIVVLEDGNIGRGISRSLALTRGFTWRTAGYFLGVLMVSSAFRAAVHAPAVMVMLRWIAPMVQDFSGVVANTPISVVAVMGVSAAVAEVFAMPFERACWTQYYLDMRSRREGMDLLIEARELASEAA
ncbi:MAG: hypothetical protein Kow0056_07430 [Coriobacteriia bacterium]